MKKEMRQPERRRDETRLIYLVDNLAKESNLMLKARESTLKSMAEMLLELLDEAGLSDIEFDLTPEAKNYLRNISFDPVLPHSIGFSAEYGDWTYVLDLEEAQVVCKEIADPRSCKPSKNRAVVEFAAVFLRNKENRCEMFCKDGWKEIERGSAS